MISDQDATPTTDILEDSLSPTFNATSFPLLASDAASSSHPHPLNSPASIIPDHPTDATSSNYDGSIDKDDIVIVYVFLELGFLD